VKPTKLTSLGFIGFLLKLETRHLQMKSLGGPSRIPARQTHRAGTRKKDVVELIKLKSVEMDSNRATGRESQAL
jgi:hypothetical protein